MILTGADITIALPARPVDGRAADARLSGERCLSGLQRHECRDYQCELGSLAGPRHAERAYQVFSELRLRNANFEDAFVLKTVWMGRTLGQCIVDWKLRSLLEQRTAPADLGIEGNSEFSPNLLGAYPFDGSEADDTEGHFEYLFRFRCIPKMEGLATLFGGDSGTKSFRRDDNSSLRVLDCLGRRLDCTVLLIGCSTAGSWRTLVTSERNVYLNLTGGQRQQ